MKYKDEDNRIVALNESGEVIGEVTFSIAGEHIWIADHTYVSDDYRGYGIAQELVSRLVERAKTEGKKIIPLCPYVKSEFVRVPAYQEVMK